MLRVKPIFCVPLSPYNSLPHQSDKYVFMFYSVIVLNYDPKREAFGIRGGQSAARQSQFHRLFYPYW